jgi:predicted alpha/beta hydrolase
MNHEVEKLRVTTGDGHSFELSLHPVDDRHRGPFVICTPAMGVEARYYEPLVRALNREGLGAALTDLRGLGLSSMRPSRRVDFGYNEIISRDIPAILEALEAKFPGAEFFLLGHSLGGQVSSLYAGLRPDSVAGLVLVATCSVFYRGWAFPTSLGVLMFEQFAYLVARILGYYPGNLFRFGGREARTLMGDWSRQGRTGEYRVTGNPNNFEHLLSTMKVPVLSISFSDDKLAPLKAVEHLLNKMRNSDVEHRRLAPEDVGLDRLGHFGWVKNAEVIAPIVAEWIRAVSTDDGFPGGS